MALARAERTVGASGKWPGREAFSQAVLARPLSVTPASKQKEFLDTKESSTWPLPGLPGLAFEFRNSTCQSSQTAQAILGALLPPLKIARNLLHC